MDILPDKDSRIQSPLDQRIADLTEKIGSRAALSSLALSAPGSEKILDEYEANQTRSILGPEIEELVVR
mgnify:CR=1 FL=1